MNKTLDDAKAEIATFCGHRLSKDCYYTCAKNRKRKKKVSEKFIFRARDIYVRSLQGDTYTRFSLAL